MSTSIELESNEIRNKLDELQEEPFGVLGAGLLGWGFARGSF